MIYEKLEQALKQSYQDYKLSKTEKLALAELFLDYKENSEALSFTRNYAFDCVRTTMRESEEYRQGALKWLEHVIRALDSVQNIKSHDFFESFFSPGSECANRIISLTKQATKNIDVCVFTISDDNITAALVEAHRRGVIVRIVTDNDKSNDRGSDIDELSNQGIQIRMDNTSNHMHHKYALFDKNVLLNGSFNWTRSASRYNHENITVISQKKLVAQFNKQFDKLWKEFDQK